MNAAGDPGAPGSFRILVVEDESDIRELLSLRLRREGYRVMEAAEGESALRMLRDPESEPFDLCILDWMLPGLSGLELIRILGREPAPDRGRPGVLMITARADSSDVVQGLEAGADDYLTKPFDVPVLLARVRALLRRAAAGQRPEDSESLRIGELVIDLRGHEARCRDSRIALTPSEFKLLHALLRGQGTVLTRRMLIEQVQGAEVSVVDRAIDTHVFGLRKKLGDCGAVIETVRGVGYRIKPGG